VFDDYSENQPNQWRVGKWREREKGMLLPRNSQKRPIVYF